MRNVQIIEKFNNDWTLLRLTDATYTPIVYAYQFCDMDNTWSLGKYFTSVEDFVNYKIKTSKFADILADLAQWLEDNGELKEALDNFSHYIYSEDPEDGYDYIIPDTVENLLYAINTEMIE